jgi:hypothetical protein
MFENDILDLLDDFIDHKNVDHQVNLYCKINLLVKLI